ncbi:FAD-dependent oxidoreductase [Mesorhizobium sp. B2-3-5]|uniref:FAD binding domain-containing protein n=1 Tax=Mesorhizobium sp. B2-3-5 TaxID=2589958 RepID=UPI0015E2FE96|nr:FAD-dependent oxidoreductase [Mesorhizobium sp. B2-3-5]
MAAVRKNGKSPRAVIIGGSTSGLMTAALLRQQAWEVNIYERSPIALVGRGAGIVCHDELFRALERSSAGTKDLGVEVEERVAFDDEGQIIGRREFPQTVTSWDRLFQLVRKTVPDDCYHLNHHLARVEQDGDVVRAIFENGNVVEGDLLVGADGFRSAVRQHFLPEVQPEYSGYLIWRGLADESALDPKIRDLVFDKFTFHFPHGTEILGYPIAGINNDLRAGKRRYNWVWYRKTSAAALDDMLTDGDGRYNALGIAPAAIRPQFVAQMRADADMIVSPPLRHVLAKIDNPFFTPILDLLSPRFNEGRIALVGDAAVVARPHVGYGTTKAAADAVALADAIGTGDGDLPARLRHYSDDRHGVGALCFHRGRQLGSWISGDEPRTQKERDEYADLHTIEGVLRHVASGEFLLI